MARTLDPVAHALKRDAFVEVAERLIASIGYEQMSVEDVIAELGVTKGAFYHYFETKAALLAAAVEHMTRAATASVAPLLDDPDLSGVEKLEGVFTSIAQWKGARTDLMFELMRVWFSDDNTVVREALRRAVATHMTPVLTAIIRQGTAEGAFSVTSPEGAANVFVSLILGLNEVAGRLFLARQVGAVPFEEVVRTLAAYREAFERILGLPAGSLTIGDDTTLHRFFN